MIIQKLQSIRPTISNAVEKYKYTRHQAQLNRLVDLSGVSNEACKELIGAQEGLANYAKAKNIRISFNNIPQEDFMKIIVTHKNGTQAKAVINGNSNEVETVKHQKRQILINKDNVIYETYGIESNEDNFQRRTYRMVEMLTNYITKNK